MTWRDLIFGFSAIWTRERSASGFANGFIARYLFTLWLPITRSLLLRFYYIRIYSSNRDNRSII